MADRKISDLTALTAPASGDYLPIVDISEAAAANKNKRITIEELFRGVPLGTAAAPSIAIEGNENTGIYSPGAYQLAISTNGAGRLFVDASGNVGVGVGNPQALLHIKDASTSAYCYSIPAASNTAYIECVTSGSGRSGTTYGLSNANLAVINAASPSAFAIGTNSDTAPVVFATNNTERLRITSTGTVNIVGAGTAGSTQAISFNGSAPVNSLVVDSSGRCGIGTTPGYTLDVAGTIRANTAIATSLTNGILQAREFGGNSANNVIEYSIRPASGKSGYLTFTEDAVADRWSIGIQNGSDGLRFISGTPTTGTERCRIDGSGRLLVGTSTAQGDYTLQIQGDAVSASAAGCIYLRRGLNTAAIGANVGADLGKIQFGANDGTVAARIQCLSDATWGSTSDTPGALTFSTTEDGASSPTERMRITSAGALKASSVSFADGVSAKTHVLFNRNNASGDICLYLGMDANAINTSSNMLVCTNIGVADVFFIRGNGNALNTNNSYTGISDVKLKENVVDANSQWQDIKALQVRNYNFKEETGHSTHRQIGLIAQEVEAVCPHLVDESPDRDPEGNDLGTVTKSVNYSVLYMKAVKALQEAMERIEQLEAEMAEVKAQLS